MGGRSAGILLFKLDQRRPLVLLVHPGGPLWSRKDQGAWSVPKGEYAEPEQPRTAALREFREETGLLLPDSQLIELGEVKQKSGKLVTVWAAEGEFDVTELRSNTFEMRWPPRSGPPRSFPEVDRAGWFDPDTARDKINPAQAAFVTRLETTLRDYGRIDPD